MTFGTASLSDNTRNKNLLIDFLVLIYFCLKPIYIFDSGDIQPADIIMIFLFLTLFLLINRKSNVNTRYTRDAAELKSVMIILIIFSGWTAIVNGIWFFALAELTILKPVLFYFFNFFAVAVYYMYYLMFGERLFKVVKVSVIATLMIQIVIYFTLVSTGGRATLAFNNPNQLGYFSLIALTFLLVLSDEKLNIAYIIAICIGTWLSMLSLSKAAMISTFFILIIYILFKKNSNKLMKYFLIAVMLATIFFIAARMELLANIPVLNNAMTRITYLQNDDSLIYGRGYGRIFEMGINFIWGMGEGAFYRFSYLNDSELHGTIAGTFVNYGLIGLVLFMIVLWKGFLQHKTKYLDKVLLVSGVFLYWVTHQGIRNSLFWILLAVFNLYINKCSYRE
jgi:hypothetical protein